jgi:hypothetical protein
MELESELQLDNSYSNNYFLISKNTLQINIRDDLSFKEYKNIVLTQIINRTGEPLHIVWNFLKLKNIPWYQLGSQSTFMRSIDSVIWSKINKMTLVVKNKKSKIPFFVKKVLFFYNKKIPISVKYLEL